MTASLFLSYAAAHLFWFALFAPAARGVVNFWLGMAIACGLLAAIAVACQRRYLAFLFSYRKEYCAAGLVSALALYGIFYACHALSVRLLPFASSEINRVYAPRADMPALFIGMLLAFLIGPAEEVVWRGFFQQRLSARYGKTRGYAAASLLYACVHVYALNIMLLLAALICGLYWGALYRKYGSLWPVIISHALWDVLVFVVFPIGIS